jgi:transcriptional regulator with XRE-family HTH domain
MEEALVVDEKELLAFVIGFRIQNMRKKKKMTQTALGIGLGSQPLISLIESGRCLPAPDILLEIGKRLNDEQIQNYAENLENEGIKSLDLIENNKELLLNALLDFHNKWSKIHEIIATTLCDYYYNKKILESVTKITEAIINNISSGPTYVQACFYRGSMFLHNHDYEEARQWLKNAELNIDLLEYILKARLLYNLGYLYTQTGNQSTALWYAKLAAKQFEFTQDVYAQTKTIGLIGVIERRMGQINDSEKSLLHAYGLLSRLDEDLEAQARTACTLAEVYLELGRLNETEEWCLKSINIGQKVGDIPSVYNSFHTLSILKWLQGDSNQSRKYLDESIEAAQACNDKVALSKMYMTATWIYPDILDRLNFATRAYEIFSVKDHALKGLITQRLSQLNGDIGNTEKYEEYRTEALKEYQLYALETQSYTFTNIFNTK